MNKTKLKKILNEQKNKKRQKKKKIKKLKQRKKPIKEQPFKDLREE